MIHEEEVRCSIETAMKIKEMDTTSLLSSTSPFAKALGIPLVVSEGVPEGKAQFWRDGEILMEIDI